MGSVVHSRVENSRKGSEQRARADQIVCRWIRRLNKLNGRSTALSGENYSRGRLGVKNNLAFFTRLPLEDDSMG
jgi:hypothetical protein